ncbi:hypothetical protein ACPCYX_24745 [Pseudomonas fluorescens]|uniref:hypothetical protein n=1 Tax=Pseudomonas fluorescens TaxID=294 RepID=UPI00178520C8|nr:hypothetical protein [Pseudomonas fluorescens]
MGTDLEIAQSQTEASMPLTTLLRCDDLVDTGNYYRKTLGFTVAELDVHLE